MAVGQLLMAGPTRQKRKPVSAWPEAQRGNVAELAARERGYAKADQWMAGPERAGAVAAGDAAALMAATPAPRKTTAELLADTESLLPPADAARARTIREAKARPGPGRSLRAILLV